MLGNYIQTQVCKMVVNFIADATLTYQLKLGQI